MAAEKRKLKHETEKQRWDRNFADLLQELRVAQTGVQILFAFLLTLPFSSGFPNTTAFQKDTYVVALIAAAFATAMIISPVAFHRALFRQGRKPELVRYAHRMASGGLAFMLIAMVSSVLLITDYLLNIWAAVILTVITAAWFLTFWAFIPWTRRKWMDEDEEDDDDEYESEAAEPASEASRV
jgi:Ca2+/Na+ antiporter